MFSVYIIPQLKDNYSYILRDEQHNITCVIDPSEAKKIIDFLDSRAWRLNYILNTHHHFDHTGGNSALKEKYQAKIIASIYDVNNIKDIDVTLSDKDEFKFPSLCKVIHIPGHTLGHIAYHFPKEKYLFTGDTLFSIGCGRLFEGTAEQMFNSLKIISSFDKNTQIYPGHEYTLNNIKFAMSIEPTNKDLAEFHHITQERMANNHTTIPSNLKTELDFNPFLRTSDLNIRNNLAMLWADDLAIFTELRKRKDIF